MNNEMEDVKNFSVDTIHVTAPSILNKPSQTMPQRSPFAIQELLGLGDSQHHRSPTAAVSAITPNVYPHQKYQLQAPTGFHPSEHGFSHHHMTMAASRMAYFNAQAAVAAAFLPHGIAAQMNVGTGGGPGSAAAVFGLAAGHQNTGSGFRNGSGPCNGDSGSAFLLRKSDVFYLRGIVSTALSEATHRSCNLQEYVVFADASKYLDWIMHIIQTS